MRYDNVTICYQGIQRTYRNAVVGYIRHEFTTAFSSKAEEELRKPFKKEWDEIHAAAFERRDTGEVAAPLKDAFDIIGVNHFYSLFEAFFHTLCPGKAATGEKERKSAKQALLGWMKVIKNFRDPLSHPAEIDFDDEDARNMLYCARKVLDFLHLTEAAKQIVELQRELDADAPVNVNIVYLPPADEVVVDFIGRQGEVQRLHEWLHDPYAARWALAGDGGKGKSAIAYEFAREVASRGHPEVEAVIWLSAKVRRFVAGRTIVVDRPDFTDLQSSLDAVLRAYGWDVPENIEAKRQETLSLLNEIPALLIVDDIDTLENSGSGAVPFLLMDVPAKTNTRVLVTSRRILFGLESCTTQVAGFSHKDAVGFIESRCRLLSLHPTGVLKHKEAIIEATDASPLYIEDLLRLVHVGVPVTQAIGLWKQKRGDAARDYAIRREFDQLSEEAQQVLLALTVFEGPCTMEQLRVALDWNVERVVDAQQSLRNLYLMPTVTGDADTQCMVLNTNTRILVERVFSKTEEFRRVKRSVDAVIGRLSPSAGEQQSVDQALRWVTTTVTRTSRQDEALEQCVRRLAELNERWPGRSDINGMLGWVFKRMQRDTDAREAFRRAQELGSKEGHVYWHWSDLEAKAEEWTEAIRIAELGCKVSPSDAGMHQHLGYCYSRAGQEAMKTGDEKRGIILCKKAQVNLQQAADLPDLDFRRSTRGKLWRSLVLNAHSMRDGEAVNRYLLEWRQGGPLDSAFEFEYERLRPHYPGHIKYLNELPAVSTKR
jgi:tetratricopeptide (TPR) repeat protein